MTRTQKYNNLIDRTKGRIFRVTFIKSDGTQRVMICRTGVKKGVNGNGNKMNENAAMIRRHVYDMQKQSFRTIPLDKIINIKIQGIEINYISDPIWEPNFFQTCPKCYNHHFENECEYCGHYDPISILAN